MIDLLYMLEAFVPDLEKVIKLIGGVILIFGIADAFFGYKLFNVLLAIMGFLTGAVLGVVIFFSSSSHSIDGDTILAYVLIGGFIGVALAEVFHKLGVFLAVGAMGAIIVFLMTQNSQGALIVGGIVGVVGVCLEKYVIIIATALSGGSLSAMGIWFIGLSNGENRNVGFIGCLIGICGIVVQLLMEKWLPKEENLEESGGIIGDITVLWEEGRFGHNVVKAVVIIILLFLSLFLFIPILFCMAIFDAILMVLYLRKSREEKSLDKNTQRHAWEKKMDSFMDNDKFQAFEMIASLILLFVSVIMLFIFFGKEGAGLLRVFLVGSIGVHIVLLKHLVNAKPKAPDSDISENNDQDTQQNESILQCPKCGNILADDSIFCSECGFKVREK